MIMAELEPDLARLRPLFVLEKLSPQLRSDVLADGSIVSACGFTAKRPTQLTDDIVVIRDELFAVWRNASNVPKTYQVHDAEDRPIDATISINDDGSGTVDISGKNFRFPWVTLLSLEIDKRLSQLDRFLYLYPLSQGDAASLRTLVARPEYSDDDFLTAAALLESSPEAFVERLNHKLRRQGSETRIAPIDVLPHDVRYWNHLVPPVDGSVTLADYVTRELRATWQASLESDAVRAMHTLATTFAAPELVPRALLREQNPDKIAAAIESVANVEDPFSLAGAFEICSDHVGQDQRFIALGDRLLDKLFADMQRLTGTCALFAAIFVITTGHFATHETLRRQPVRWRRLAAAAHASLIARLCDGKSIDPDKIVSWAIRLFGDAYFLSVMSDFAVEPQWRPEWIIPKVLIADVFGRIAGAWRILPEDAAPVSWKERIDNVFAWIRQEQIGAFAQYPSVLQGTRRQHDLPLAELQASIPQAGDAFRQLANEPSASMLLSMSPFIAAFGFPREATGDAEKVLTSIRTAAPDDDDKIVVLALSVLAHIAVLTDNSALADSISEVCLERACRSDSSRSIFEIVCRLIECTAVIKDRSEAARTLARRLEMLAFLVPASEAADRLVDTIEMVKSVQPELAPLLGRALAVARLGSPRAVAA
jgi:hypothetical protein